MNQQQMVTGTLCKPEPIIPKKKYCTWNTSKPQIGIFVDLKLSRCKIYEF